MEAEELPSLMELYLKDSTTLNTTHSKSMMPMIRAYVKFTFSFQMER